MILAVIIFVRDIKVLYLFKIEFPLISNEFILIMLPVATAVFEIANIFELVAKSTLSYSVIS